MAILTNAADHVNIRFNSQTTQKVKKKVQKSRTNDRETILHIIDRKTHTNFTDKFSKTFRT